MGKPNQFRDVMYEIGRGKEYEEIETKRRQLIRELNYEDLVMYHKAGLRDPLLDQRYKDLTT